MTLNPLNLSGKRLWLRAKDLGAVGSTFTTWPDQSGAGRNVTKTAGTPVVSELAATPTPMTVSASSQFSATVGSQDGPAANAVDGSTGTNWTTNGVAAGWFMWSASSPVAVNGYTIRRRDDIPNRSPKAFTFEASNDASSWTVLDTRTNVLWPTSGETKTFNFTNTTAYSYYRLNVTANGGDAYLSIPELGLIFPSVTTKPTVRTSGATLTIPTADSGGTTRELWIVVRSIAAAETSPWKFGTSGNLTHFPYTAQTVYDDSFSTSRQTFNSSLTLTGATRIYRVTMTGGVWKAYVDGVQQANVSGLTFGLSTSTFLCQSWDGYISEVLIRDTISTTDETAWLIDYFNTEHGLSVAGGVPAPNQAGGAAAGTFTFAGSATGKKVAAGLAAGAFVFAGAAAGARTPKAAASGAFSFAGSAAGSAPVLGPAEGSASGAFNFAGSAVGSKPQRGSASGGFAFSGTAVGSAPVVLPNTGAAAGTLTFTGNAVGLRASRATAAGSFVWAGAAAGTNSAIPVGSAAGSFSWIGLASGANGTTTIPTDPTDIPFGTEDGELDALPALDPTPPGMVQRPLWRRSVIVPRLKDIPGVIIDPETSQPRIPAAVYATFPVIEEEVGVPHVIFPGRDGVHDMTYYRRNRSRIVSTRAEEPFGDTSAQVEFPQITSMDDDPDGLTSPHPWTKIRANMEVVWRKSDGSIRRHWAGNVFSRNVGNDGKSPFLRITALGSLRMAGNAINKPLNRQDPLDLGTIIPRTLNSVVSRRYNAVPHVTTGILSKKRGSWSDSALGFVQDCLADAWTLSGNQWTIAKIPGTRRAYEMRLKKTTPSWTITNGAMGVSVDLNKDGAVRNVIYGHGVRDDGGVWRNTFYFDGTDPNDGVRLPLAADPRTQKRILHPSGLGMMDNPDYDENIPAYEDDVDFGQCSVAVGTYSAQQIVDRESIPSLSGRITLRTDPREGSRVFIPAGDKIRVLGYEGRDVVLHIASVEVDYQSYEVTLEVSERSHDALTLAQIRSLQKDARRDPAMRPGNPNRRSRLEQDQTPPFDAESRAGIIAPRTAPGGQWSGQAYPFAGAGRIVKTHFEAGSPFAVAITAKPISAAHLGSIVGNPLTNYNPFEPHLKVLENTYGLVACWGQKGQRMGYSSGREDNGGAFTGNFDEYQTWEYVSGDGVKLWVFVFPLSTTTFSGRCYPGAEL